MRVGWCSPAARMLAAEGGSRSASAARRVRWRSAQARRRANSRGTEREREREERVRIGRCERVGMWGRAMIRGPLMGRSLCRSVMG